MNKKEHTSHIKFLPLTGAGKGNIWLILELILVTVACWWAFNPVIVSLYKELQPYGFKTDKIIRIEIGSSFTAEKERLSVVTKETEHEILCKKIEELDEVISAHWELGCDKKSIGFYESYSATSYFSDKDSVIADVYSFERDSRIFQTYGIESLTPGISTNELTNNCEPNESVIISRTMALGLFGTTDVAGRKISTISPNWNFEGNVEYKKRPLTIRAVVEDVRSSMYYENCGTIYECQWPGNGSAIIVRLRDDVNAERFIERCKTELEHSLVTDHYYIRDMKIARDYLKEAYENSWDGIKTRRNMLIAAFFACNLTFGVIGTLLMYTRQRREEAGIKMAFGAKRLGIFLGFLREAWMITTFSVLIGCLIILHLGFANCIAIEEYNSNPKISLWYHEFWPTFFIVSGIVYLIILSFVLLGTIIPAWRISRSRITEALRE